MTSLKPYLIRGVYEWLLANNLTPYLLVNAERNTGSLPVDFIENGKITLNLRPEAVEALSIGNDVIEFNARFHGRAMTVVVSVNSVLAIYAKEHGKGFYAQEDGTGLVLDLDPGHSDDTPPDVPSPSQRPSLRVVK